MITTKPLAAETCRGLQLERLIRLAQFLRSRRLPLPMADIACQIREETGGDWCERTIRRDMELLELVGLVQRETYTIEKNGRPGVRWKWVAPGSLFDLAPSAAGLARDETRLPHWRFPKKPAAF